MKFILFVEGQTEKAVPPFLKRWLDERLTKSAGIKPVLFEGWSQLWRDTPAKAKLYLEGPDKENIIAVISLMDLYGPTFYPKDKISVAERYNWAKAEGERLVGQPKFRQQFAVHEIEAWLLSQPTLFPQEIQKLLPAKIQKPETVNFNEPPAKLLNKLYEKSFNREYKKTTNGANLFPQLNPDIAYGKCYYLQKMLDEMLMLAQEAGL